MNEYTGMAKADRYDCPYDADNQMGSASRTHLSYAAR